MELKNLKEASKEEVEAFLSSFDTVLTDCDGVLWHGNQAIEGSPQMIQKFRKLGKKVIFVTNNSSKTRSEFVQKSKDLGFGGELEEFFTTSLLVAEYLKNIGFDKKVYLHSYPGMAKSLDECGIKHIGLGPDPSPNNWSPECLVKAASELDPEVGCVVTSLDWQTSYIKIIKVCSYLQNPEVMFLVPNMDERIPDGSDLLLPGTGSMVNMFKSVTQRQPIVLGKPEKYIFEAVQKKFPDIEPSRTLMIGDKYDIFYFSQVCFKTIAFCFSLKTDIQMGKNCDLKTLLVGTGVDNVETARNLDLNQRPDYFIPSLGDLLYQD